LATATRAASSVPCGVTSEGLPIGIQIVGRRFDEYPSHIDSQKS
jgi:Asp-tRNA(Asn)/Glu-tRNA(Gln) amidotransferase A subunit family amidase